MFTAPVQPDEATVDVLAAFRSAQAASRSPVECYRAAVRVWLQRHPDHAPEYAAKRAVAVILAYVVDATVG
jgi:hypothetical protein